MQPIDQMVEERSTFGRAKYQVQDPDAPEGTTVELFWFRNLPQDIREELADAGVYGNRLEERLAALDLPGWVQEMIKGHMTEMYAAVEAAFYEINMVELWLTRFAPDLVTDQEEYWAPFKPRQRFPAG